MGCASIRYFWQAGVGQLSLYNHERPIAEVLDDPSTPQKYKDRLKLLPEVRKFVETELGVSSTNNYKTFVDLKRPYVVWSLTSAEAEELKLVEWNFPVVGSFPYIGFFNENMAKEWQEKEKSKGRDTHLRGVTAYSTLGYLRDPLLSSMLSDNQAYLANLLFHETTHTYIYLKGEGSFNEQLASYVGDYGERLWLSKKYGSESLEVKDWEFEREDRRLFGLLIRNCAEDLKKIFSKKNEYGSSKTIILKNEIYSSLKKKMLETPWKSKYYVRNVSKRFADEIQNNAALFAFLTYEDNQEVFDRLHEVCGRDVRHGFEYLKKFSVEYGEMIKNKNKLIPMDVLRDRLKNNKCL